MAAGILLLLFGLWVLLRTVHTGDNGKNLTDYLIGGGSSSKSSNPLSGVSNFFNDPLGTLGNAAYQYGAQQFRTLGGLAPTPYTGPIANPPPWRTRYRQPGLGGV